MVWCVFVVGVYDVHVCGIWYMCVILGVCMREMTWRYMVVCDIYCVLYLCVVYNVCVIWYKECERGMLLGYTVWSMYVFL